MSGFFARLGAGLAAAALVWGTGLALERQRFGATDQVSVSRIEAELAARFEDGATTLTVIAAPVAEDSALVEQAARDTTATRALFDTLDGLLPDAADRAAGLTVYGLTGEPIAWAGRVSDLPEERITGPASLFVAPGALGPRLVRVTPVGGVDAVSGRTGSVVAEQLLGEVQVTPSFTDTFEMATSLAPVSLRTRLGEAAETSPYTLVIPASDGQLLVEARVDPAALAAARSRWRDATFGAVLVIVALTLVASAVP